MSESVWDTERLRIVGSVLSRYSTHLSPGDRIRMGMEGDECSLYRSSTDAPCATVLDVQRDPNGYVRFRAQLDGSGGVVELDNRNVAPDRIWEIDPEYIETFRGNVERSLQGTTNPTTNPTTDDPIENMDEETVENTHDPEPIQSTRFEKYRSSLMTSLDERLDERLHTYSEEYRSSLMSTMDERLRAHRDEMKHEISLTDSDFQHTVASAIRMIAGDVLRLSRGEPVEFADQYADRYDLAVTDREFRSTSPTTKRDDKYQGEKYDFENGHAVYTSSEVSNLNE